MRNIGKGTYVAKLDMMANGEARLPRLPLGQEFEEVREHSEIEWLVWLMLVARATKLHET